MWHFLAVRGYPEQRHPSESLTAGDYAEMNFRAKFNYTVAASDVNRLRASLG